jgi:phytoene synthase
LIRFELDRAEAYYRQAEPLLGMVGCRSRPALWAIIAIYHGVLKRIRELDARILATRARLTNWEKTAVVLRAGRARWLGGRLPYPA